MAPATLVDCPRQDAAPAFAALSLPELQAGRPDRALRMLGYAAVVAVIAGFTCFFRLVDAEGMLIGDEVTYAQVLDSLRDGGDWLTPRLPGGKLFHDKPPLYWWLTELTYSWFEDGNSPLPYRFWAAAFGWCAALLTFYVGTRWWNAEAGLVAGLCLALNPSFLFQRGARHGILDSGVTFFVLAAVAGYAMTRGKWPRCGWLLAGAAAGAACMMKPPVIGGFFLVVLCLHHWITRRNLPRKQRLIGPLLAASACLVVAAPWHLHQWWLWGDAFVDSYVRRWIWDRAAKGINGHVQGPLFYWQQISQASRVFWLTWPALAAVVVASWRSRLPWQGGLLLTLVLSFMAVMSLSASKALCYLYPIFPLVCLAIGVFIVDLLPGALAGTIRLRRTPALFCAVALLAVLVRKDVVYARAALTHSALPYVPLAFHEQAAPALQAGHGRLVMYQLLSHPPVNNQDSFYARRMPAALFVETAAELSDLIAAEEPLVVVGLAGADLDNVWARLAPQDGERYELAAPWRSFTVLSFHRGLAALGLETYVQNCRPASSFSTGR